VTVAKRYLMIVAAHNLGVVMRSVFGVGKPRVLPGAAGAVVTLVVGRTSVGIVWIVW
jgi:hypothetical protein